MGREVGPYFYGRYYIYIYHYACTILCPYHSSLQSNEQYCIAGSDKKLVKKFAEIT